MPIVSILPFIFEAFLITCFKALSVVDQISFGLCSTQPFLGKYCLNSNCETKTILPLVSNKITLDDVVP